MESGVQLALAVVNPIYEILNSGTLEINRTCGAGSLTATVVDNDGNGSLSTGDTVSVRYENGCFSAELGDETTGEMRFEIEESVAPPTGGLLLRGSLSFPGAFTTGVINTVSVSGSLDIAMIVQGGFEILEVDVTAGSTLSLAIAVDGSTTTERLSLLDLRRVVDLRNGTDKPYSLNASTRVASELLDGTIECTTTEELVAEEVNEEPLAGQLDCVGRANSTVRLDSNRAFVDTAIGLLVDPEGDGSFVSVAGNPARWGQFLEGALFDERIRSRNIPPPPDTPMLTPLSTSASVNRIIHAPVRNRLLATTATGVIEIDPATMAITRDVPVAGSPGELALSDDETSLWIALDDSNELQRFSYPDLTAGSTYPLGESSVVTGLPRDVFQLEVAPGTTDLVVVATSSAVEIVAYSNGVELPNLIGGSAPRAFAFRDAQNLVAVDDRSTGLEARRLTLDPATGLTAGPKLPGLSGRLRGKLKIGTDNVFATERVFNELTESVEAFLMPADAVGGFFNTEIQVDGTADTVYAIAGSLVDLYDENAFTHVGRYRTESIPSATLLTPEYLIVATENQVDRYSRADMQRNLTFEPCTRVDVSELWSAGTYVQLGCLIREMSYDPDRDRIYAALPNFTDRGNSVAVIDPTDLSITDYVPVGGTPKSLRISDDGSTLFAILDETTKVVEIDLDTLIVGDITSPIGFDVVEPFLPVDLAPTTQSGGEFVAILNNRVGLLGGGATIGSISPFAGGTPDQIFVTTDGGTAITRDFNNIAVFGVSAAGIEPLTTQNGTAFPRPSVQRGDFFYEARGTRFNLATQSFEDICTLPPIGFGPDVRVGPDTGSERVYYGVIATPFNQFAAEVFNLIACDPATQAVGQVKTEPAFEVLEGDVVQVLPVSDDRVVVLTTTHAVLIDRPTL